MMRRRSGFTLIELLLALAISGVLLAAISSSVLSHYSIQDRGLRNIDAGRSTLTISQRLRADLSTVSLASRHREQPNLGSTDSRWDSGVRELLLTSEFQFSNNTIALVGTETSLVLGRFQPGASADQVGTNSPELVHTSVLWTDANLGSITFPFLQHDGHVGDIRIANESTFQDALTPQMREYLGPVRRITVKLDSSEVLDTARYPRCVQSLRFRYFDGEQWLTSWNSEKSHQLPRLVEARILTSDGSWQAVLCSVGANQGPKQ